MLVIDYILVFFFFYFLPTPYLRAKKYNSFYRWGGIGVVAERRVSFQEHMVRF